MNALMFAAADKVMKVLTNPMLGDGGTGGTGTGTGTGTEQELFSGKWAWVKEVTEAIQTVLLPLLILIATAGIIYVIILGVNLARAESADKQKEAKQRIVNFIVAIVVTIALVLLMYLVCEYLPQWIGVDGKAK